MLLDHLNIAVCRLYLQKKSCFFSITLFFRSPLNEDVFTMPLAQENRVTTPDIVQLSEQIHRLLVQPVHSSSSQGYSSLGSSGSRGSHRSHQQHLSASAASSSDSNGPAMDEAAAGAALHKPVSLETLSVSKTLYLIFLL